MPREENPREQRDKLRLGRFSLLAKKRRLVVVYVLLDGCLLVSPLPFSHADGRRLGRAWWFPLVELVAVFRLLPPPLPRRKRLMLVDLLYFSGSPRCPFVAKHGFMSAFTHTGL